MLLQLIAFATAVNALADRTLIVTFDDNAVVTFTLPKLTTSQWGNQPPHPEIPGTLTASGSPLYFGFISLPLDSFSMTR